MLCLSNKIKLEIEKIIWKNQNGFRRNRFKISQILSIRRIIKGVRAKNIEATLLFEDFSKVFDSIKRGKIEQIQLAYGLPKETVTTIVMLYKKHERNGLLTDGRPLRLVNEFTYFGSNISSTESNVNIRLAKVWAAINRLSIIWKSDLSYKIRRDFFSKRQYCCMDAPHGR